MVHQFHTVTFVKLYKLIKCLYCVAPTFVAVVAASNVWAPVERLKSLWTNIAPNIGTGFHNLMVIATA